MALTFEQVDEIFRKKFGLLSKSRKSGKYMLHSYYFADKYINTNKSEVASRVCALLKGGVGGYIYVEHLPEYNNHPDRHGDRYLNIGKMEEQELIETTAKVTQHYK